MELLKEVVRPFEDIWVHLLNSTYNLSFKKRLLWSLDMDRREIVPLWSPFITWRSLPRTSMNKYHEPSISLSGLTKLRGSINSSWLIPKGRNLYNFSDNTWSCPPPPPQSLTTNVAKTVSNLAFKVCCQYDELYSIQAM